MAWMSSGRFKDPFILFAKRIGIHEISLVLRKISSFWNAKRIHEFTGKYRDSSRRPCITFTYERSWEFAQVGRQSWYCMSSSDDVISWHNLLLHLELPVYKNCRFAKLIRLGRCFALLWESSLPQRGHAKRWANLRLVILISLFHALIKVPWRIIEEETVGDKTVRGQAQRIT